MKGKTPRVNPQITTVIVNTVDEELQIFVSGIAFRFGDIRSVQAETGLNAVCELANDEENEAEKALDHRVATSLHFDTDITRI